VTDTKTCSVGHLLCRYY